MDVKKQLQQNLYSTW